VTDEHVPGGTNTSGIVMPGATQTSGDAAPETGQTPAGVRYRPRDRVLAVRYPTEPDVVREVEIRGLARTLGLEPHVPFDYTRFSGGRNLPTREILLGQGNYAIRVPRGHWFVVHPRPGKPLLEVLSDTDFRATFTGPARSAEGERELADAVTAQPESLASLLCAGAGDGAGLPAAPSPASYPPVPNCSVDGGLESGEPIDGDAVVGVGQLDADEGPAGGERGFAGGTRAGTGVKHDTAGAADVDKLGQQALDGLLGNVAPLATAGLTGGEQARHIDLALVVIGAIAAPQDVLACGTKSTATGAVDGFVPAYGALPRPAGHLERVRRGGKLAPVGEHQKVGPVNADAQALGEDQR
jgi:hypothetical protein